MAYAAVRNDIILTPDCPKTLLLEKHSDYLAAYGLRNDDYEYCMTEYLRMSGIYWSVAAMELMGQGDRMPKEDIIEFIRACQDKVSGGISASKGHDPHILYTLSAVQVLAMYDRLDAIDIEGVVKYTASMQQRDGSFTGDKWGEVDTRFSFCAVMILSLLHRLETISIRLTVNFILSCMNFDGGFGTKPGCESHAGLIYCCVGTLSICNRLDVLKVEDLTWWLCERQLPSGGLNGRPEKLPDLCYSWWVMASLSMMNKMHTVNTEALEQFILACQDKETGGFSDRPGDVTDPFHTLFGLAGLSLLGYDRGCPKCQDKTAGFSDGPGDVTDPFHTLFGLAGLSLLGNKSIKPVNPTYCMPQEVIDRLKLKPQVLQD